MTASSAFTFVELLIVVMILMVLAVLATTNYPAYRSGATAVKCVAQLRAIQSARLNYMTTNPLAESCASLDELASAGYFGPSGRTAPTCPAGGTYGYLLSRADLRKLPTCSVGGQHVLLNK